MSGRAACVAAALWPERCAGLVSVNGYLIQDIAAAREFWHRTTCQDALDTACGLHLNDPTA